ncbi:hypothetical protein P152DRAFT_459841 [Eremomyces bilateralis CBS 781.70]|uniref:t-SNARE coiled-coil homology domain-containing protein n=1 Tax=Eremomyces bilateralis CBS 781.70 TaxID=1392243 RepID=A0A6G1FZ50_9PEZI|nr:uncharacterized protein P152DRAFT_459841 [Eremomyces bilateralis CBS 781.70]KAF1810971.1 hypothetical protein P152DRAFT_459841 [Eremomyces bilateralis CBS 781.70]
MASRFNSTLHQRDARSQLFSGYDSRPHSQSPSKGHKPNGGYGYQSSGPSGAFSAYPGGGAPPPDAAFRTATPDSRGRYSDAVLSELESQNDDQVEGMIGKVKVLKDITLAMGKEIRDSSALAEKMNDSFEGTRNRLRGTMNRMLRMAEKTGVGWKVWVGFFAAVIFLFWYVWLF